MESDVKPTIPTLMKVMRINKGWSQKDLAIEARTTPNTISMLESGILLRRISSILGVKTEDLLTRGERIINGALVVLKQESSIVKEQEQKPIDEGKEEEANDIIQDNPFEDAKVFTEGESLESSGTIEQMLASTPKDKAHNRPDHLKKPFKLTRASDGEKF